jgi:hypothetical protein
VKVLKWIGIIIGGLVVLFIIIGIIAVATGDNDNGATTPQTSAPEYIEITAQQLYDEYDNNEIAADQKYKDRTLKVTGYISNIGEDILGDPYITLTGSKYGFSGVHCTFPDTDVARNILAGYNTGDLVTIKGKCTGYFIDVLLEAE